VKKETHCPDCGCPVDPVADERCPKCERWLRGHDLAGLKEIDVAHGGESWEQARAKIEQAFDRALAGGHRGLMVIHGRGATTGRSVIGPRAVELLRVLAATCGGKLVRDRGNPGAHIVWFS